MNILCLMSSVNLATNHNNYLKYDSYNATQSKRAVVKSLTDRAKNLCSIETVESEKSKVQAIILKSNGCNQNIINRFFVEQTA